mmetsp:Transcript_29076/g.56182  ORF Transcript_29076/g.56182 Transcript_29076/m.56182 type:complete len:218 (+) Transcript_29076:172-825(+)
MPWGNYLKTPCEQCGTLHWALVGASSGGTRARCRMCARAPSLTSSTVATAAAAGPVAARPARNQTMTMQRSHSFQRAPAARQAQLWRVAARAQNSETAGSLVQGRLRELQLREFIARDNEMFHQLDAAHSAWQTRSARSTGSQLRPRRTIRPNALLPAPESNDWKGEDCAICLDSLTDAATVCALPRCGHCFHRACIESWLTRGKPECPLDSLEVNL